MSGAVQFTKTLSVRLGDGARIGAAGASGGTFVSSNSSTLIVSLTVQLRLELSHRLTWFAEPPSDSLKFSPSSESVRSLVEDSRSALTWNSSRPLGRTSRATTS